MSVMCILVLEASDWICGTRSDALRKTTVESGHNGSLQFMLFRIGWLVHGATIFASLYPVYEN